MCGIIGYIGDNDVAPILLDGLERLEYRGYDSAGISTINRNGDIFTTKAKGKIEQLRKKVKSEYKDISTIGIGHTRWATHGKPSDRNSHPHMSMDGRFSVVHNGIIENFSELKADLQNEGVVFASETDTEVVAQLLAKLYDGDMRSTIMKTLKKLKGAYSLGILCKDFPNEIWAVRNASPLIIGLCENQNFLASDITAVVKYTKSIYQLDDGEFARLTRDNVEIFAPTGEKISKNIVKIDWDVSAAEKGGYQHFMLKEIMEEPEAIAKTISPRINDDNSINLDGINLTAEQIKNLKKICVVACGSAWHVGMVGKYVIEELTRIPVEVDLASEFRYRNPIIDENCLCIAISQSGETADTLAALREAKSRGARILSIVNVVGSTIANESDDVLYTWAGPEIAVATTKAYSTQLTLVYLLALYMAQALNKIDDKEYNEIINAIRSLPEQVASILEQKDEIKELAKRYAYLEHAYFIGRNLDYAVSLEASLKLKEISYIHSEAYAAGELKHGTISLIEEGTVVCALCCCDRLFEKTVSNIKEVAARGAETIAVISENSPNVQLECDHKIYVPSTHELIMPSLEVIPLQLMGYYIALARKCNIDKPRNLAKSVTVE